MRPNSGTTGPYRCSQCGYKATTSRTMLQHSNKWHEDPLSLVFTDNTGREVRIRDLFITVSRCKAPGCGLVFGINDTRESQLYSTVRRHWRSQHTEQPECGDKDKVVILLGRTVTGTVECEARGCKWTQETGEYCWRKNCLDHFLRNHGDDLRQLGFRDSEERSVRIQDLYSYVGRCSQETCRHKIIAIDYQSRMDSAITCHYKNHHPRLTSHAYTPLVENGKLTMFFISAELIKSCKPCKVILYNI